MTDPDARFAEELEKRGWSMLTAPAAKGLYRPALQVGDLVFTSGHLPIRPDGSVVTGQVGQDADESTATEAAALAMAGILRTLQKQLGTLRAVGQVVRIFGLVNAAPGFAQHPRVLNGASELLAAVFGPELGVGARTAAGAAHLPVGAVVEIEAVFQLAEKPTPP